MSNVHKSSFVRYERFVKPAVVRDFEGMNLYPPLPLPYQSQRTNKFLHWLQRPCNVRATYVMAYLQSVNIESQSGIPAACGGPPCTHLLIVVPHLVHGTVAHTEMAFVAMDVYLAACAVLVVAAIAVAVDNCGCSSRAPSPWNSQTY